MTVSYYINIPSAVASVSFVLLLLAGTSVQVAKAEGLCFVLYQIADTSNIERGLIMDLIELTESSAIRDPTMTTWVYHDGRNLDGSDQSYPYEFLGDGAHEAPKFEGTRYWHYDHDLEEMVAETTLEGEQNSDDPTVLSTFVKHALEDCVAKGSSEYFMAFSSHGSGYLGFGGDDHPARGRRKLAQSNSVIASALASALADTPGAPGQFDVIGFDACLMSAAGAVDDYQAIAKTYLGSEAVEPGHGWAYADATRSDSAVELAKEFVQNFVDEKQGEVHETPKQLSLIETAAYGEFLPALDDLTIIWSSILADNNDANFYAHLTRARAEALSFDSSVDMGEKYPSVSASAQRVLCYCLFACANLLDKPSHSRNRNV